MVRDGWSVHKSHERHGQWKPRCANGYQRKLPICLERAKIPFKGGIWKISVWLIHHLIEEREAIQCLSDFIMVLSDYLAESVFQFKLDVVTSSLSTRRCSANPQADPVATTMRLAFHLLMIPAFLFVTKQLQGQTRSEDLFPHLRPLSSKLKILLLGHGALPLARVEVSELQSWAWCHKIDSTDPVICCLN